MSFYDQYEDFGLLVCDAVYYYSRLPTFKNNVSPEYGGDTLYPRIRIHYVTDQTQFLSLDNLHIVCPIFLLRD